MKAPDVLQVIVMRPWNDVSGVMVSLTADCRDYLVGQHPAEGRTKKIHIHAMLIGWPRTTDTIRNKLNAAGLKGKDFSVLERVVEKPRPYYDEEQLAPYICKGQRERLRIKSYSEERFQEFLNAWRGGAALADTIVLTQIVAEGERTELKKDAFQSLLTRYKLLERTIHTEVQIQRWIQSQYLKKELPVPRVADLKRYAYSIMKICNNEVEEHDMRDWE